MPDHHPRYVCLHYDANDCICLFGERGHASSYVLDRWYSHRHVGVYRIGTTIGTAGGRRVHVTAAQRAERLAAKLNAEHDAWLAEDQGGKVSAL